VGDIIAEPLVVNDSLPRDQVRERVEEVLEVVKLGGTKDNFTPMNSAAVRDNASLWQELLFLTQT